MTSPKNVAEFHAEYDRHPDDRVRLFQAIADVVAPSVSVLYPGSYVDLAPSVWFDDVTYVDVDDRAARFFSQTHAVVDLIDEKRLQAEGATSTPALNSVGREVSVVFHHLDYREPLPIADGSVGLLISLYAGFISEHCGDLLSPGGVLLVNPSHGDAAMASIDPRFQLAGVVTASDTQYRVETNDLDTYLVPKRPQAITKASLHESGRGVGYTKSPFAYLFTKIS